MRVLACLAVAASAESDQESLLQTSSIRRHLQNLGQSASSDAQLLATVRGQLESRANSAQTLEYFDAAMASKKHKEKTCDAEQVEELTHCLQIGAAENRTGSWHLADAVAGQMSAGDIMNGLESFGCDTLVGDMMCFRRSECYESAFSQFNFNLSVPVSDIGLPNETSMSFSAQELCAAEGNASSTVGEACAMSPKMMCEKFATSTGSNSSCEVTGCEPLGEVEGLTIGHCSADAATATDVFIATKAGCKAAVEQYAAAELDNLQAQSDHKITIKYGKALARWMRTATKPQGCYLYYKGKNGNKISGYFNAHSKLSDEETRAGDTIGTAPKQRQPLCKHFA
jgi:hypothetical protein